MNFNWRFLALSCLLLTLAGGYFIYGMAKSFGFNSLAYLISLLIYVCGIAGFVYHIFKSSKGN